MIPLYVILILGGQVVPDTLSGCIIAMPSFKCQKGHLLHFEEFVEVMVGSRNYVYSIQGVPQKIIHCFGGP